MVSRQPSTAPWQVLWFIRCWRRPGLNRNLPQRRRRWEFSGVRKKSGYFALILILAVSVPAQQTEPAAEQGGPDTIGGGVQDSAAVERGRKSFEATCAFCHGPDARGRSGPDLVRSPVVLRDVKGDQIGQVIRNGRPQKGMPAFALAQSQVEDIAAFLHSRTHLAANRFTYVISGLVTGNA